MCLSFRLGQNIYEVSLTRITINNKIVGKPFGPSVLVLYLEFWIYRPFLFLLILPIDPRTRKEKKEREVKLELKCSPCLHCASILMYDVYMNMNMMMRICLTLRHGSYCISDLLKSFYIKMLNKRNCRPLRIIWNKDPLTGICARNHMT